MQVASLTNCKKLYEISGWGDSYFLHVQDLMNRWSIDHNSNLNVIMQLPENADKDDCYPAYDLGYLLRKLQAIGTTVDDELVLKKSNFDWVAMFKGVVRLSDQSPEDAACLLAINLFEQGVLTAPSPDKESNE